MDALLHDPFREEMGHPGIEFGDRVEQTPSAEGRALVSAKESVGSAAELLDRSFDQGLPAKAPQSSRSASPSGDAVNAYFRDMDSSELLSREAEIALAKRIEAAQDALILALCQLPIVAGRIAAWQAGLAAGRVRLADLVERSSADEPDEAEDLIADDDEPGLEGVPSAEGPSKAAQMEYLSALAGEIHALSRDRLGALSRGRDLPRRGRVRLQELTSHFAREVTALRLRESRITELVGELELEQEGLQRVERELLGLAERAGISREDWLNHHSGRELDSNWLAEIDALPLIGWRRLVREHGDRVNELRHELATRAHRVGLPVPELRFALAQVSKAKRDLKAVREEMVKSHLRLVVAIARKYRRMTSLELLDLVQEGNMGLMHAIEKYDYRRGVKVSTYAVWWIRQAITRAIADQGRTIRVPVHMNETAGRVLRTRRKLRQVEGREPTPSEIAAAVGMPLSRIEQVLALVPEPTSLDLPVGEDGDATLGDLIAAPDAADPHAMAEASALSASIREALAHLPPREQNILRLRFGIDGAAEQTLEEISRIYGVTRERIRQIEMKALEKLRRPKHARKLAGFIEA